MRAELPSRARTHTVSIAQASVSEIIFSGFNLVAFTGTGAGKWQRWAITQKKEVKGHIQVRQDGRWASVRARHVVGCDSQARAKLSGRCVEGACCLPR